MGMPARKFEYEEPIVEERIARLEAHVEHIQSDVSELKVDVRRLGEKIDAVKDKIDALKDKIDGVKDSVASLALTMEKGFSKLAFTLYISLAAGLLTVIARSLHWI